MADEEKIGFEEAVEQITESDTRFQPDAYFFLRGALDETVKILGREEGMEPGRHVTGPELLEGFRKHAIEQFGPMTTTVLEEWGVTKTGDVGEIVFNLINAGVFGQSDDDRLEDFSGGYEFYDAFVRPFLPNNPIGAGAPQPRQAS